MLKALNRKSFRLEDLGNCSLVLKPEYRRSKFENPNFKWSDFVSGSRLKLRET